MHRDPHDHRETTHWSYNEHGNVRPLGRDRRMIAVSVVVAILAIVIVVADNLG